MNKIEIYTNKQCPYCKTIKEELTKKNIEFEEKLTSDFTDEYKDVVNLTGMGVVPTVFYKNNYFLPNRDFGNPAGLINLLENFKESSFSESRQALEKVKTLNQNMIMAFHKVDQLLKQIETKLNAEDEHKSTD